MRCYEADPAGRKTKPICPVFRHGLEAYQAVRDEGSRPAGSATCQPRARAPVVQQTKLVALGCTVRHIRGRAEDVTSASCTAEPTTSIADRERTRTAWMLRHRMRPRAASICDQIHFLFSSQILTV